MRMDVVGSATFIGVDLHKCSVTLRAVRADGELLGQLKCDTKCVDRLDIADATELALRRGKRRTLRWALRQAAVTLCQSDAKQEATRQRFIARMPRAKANVIMGRRLLRTLYAMVRDNKPYQCGEPRDRTKAANKAKARRRARALQPA